VRDGTLQSLSDGLNHHVGESPVKLKNLIPELAKIEGVLNEKFFKILPDRETPGPSINDGAGILCQLKERFLETTK
jgi:hypothetical protein